MNCDWLPGGVLAYMGCIGMCGRKGYGFSVVLIINRVYILQTGLELGMFLFFCVFFGQVIIRVRKIADFSHK